eukprot:GILI01011989.1.p1 GENE.GILI01011989.1~~GILI01011989.1.p1  ORF type:complete len:593 (-),score=87.74 GILI01011989.1:338-2116(-)
MDSSDPKESSHLLGKEERHIVCRDDDDDTSTVNENFTKEDIITQNHMREKEELKVAETSMFGFVRVFIDKVKSMPGTQLAFVMMLVCLLTIGNAMQLIGINFWLGQFSDGSSSGSFTILMMSGMMFAIVFTAWLVAYIFLKKPDTHFMKDKKGWILLLGVGVNDTLNSFMSIYAANLTPEVLQALFQTLLPVYACVMSKYILKDPRTYLNRWIVLSFMMITAGVVVAAVPNFTSGTSTDGATAAGWSVIYFLSVPFTALQFVWQSKYMIDYTVEQKIVLPEDTEAGNSTIKGTSRPASAHASKYRLGAGPNGQASVKFFTQSKYRLEDGLPNPPTQKEVEEDDSEYIHNNTSTRASKITAKNINNVNGDEDDNDSTLAKVTLGPTKASQFSVQRLSTVNGSGRLADGTHPNAAAMRRPYRGEDTIVKLTMLFGDVGFQLILSFMLLPADALPWWGGANSVEHAWKHFSDGTREVFTQKENFFYCAIYSGGYIMQYISAAYLNHYSATLSTMVSQLSSPITALVLIIIPSWDVTPGGGAWYWSVFAIVLLSCGTVVYSAWEEMSSQELALEMQEKERARRRATRDQATTGIAV